MHLYARPDRHVVQREGGCIETGSATFFVSDCAGVQEMSTVAWVMFRMQLLLTCDRCMSAVG